MLRAFRYLFYRLGRSNNQRDRALNPQVNAFILVVVILWWNALFVFAIVDCVLGGSLINKFSKAAAIAAAAGIALIVYFPLLHRRKFTDLALEFEPETQRQRRQRGIAVSLYVALSFILMIVAAVVRSRTAPN